MASSGSKSVRVTSFNTLVFSWSVGSQSLSGNYSIVNWRLYLKSTSNGAISSSSSKRWEVTVNGNKHSGSNTVGINSSTSKTLASGSERINHNADGEKSFNYSFSQEFDINFNGHVGTISGSGTGALNTIPRASTLKSVPSPITLGSWGNIEIDRASTKYKHTVSAKFGKYNQMITQEPTVNTVIKFSPPTNWADACVNAEKGTVVYTIKTYNGDKLIGTRTYNRELAIPANMMPTISSVTHQEAVPNVATNIGFYAKGKSKIKFTTKRSGVGGSTIKSTTYQIAGQTITGETAITDFIQKSGELSVKVTVKDSRGRIATKNLIVNVLDYFNPQITKFKVERCDSLGNIKADGDRAAISLSAKFSSLNKRNNADLSIYYRQAGTTGWTWLKTINSYSTNETICPPDIFTTDAAFNFKTVAKDSFNTAETIIAFSNVPTGSPVLDFNKSGKGLGIGKVSEIDALEINMPTFVNGVDLDKKLESLNRNIQEISKGNLTLIPVFRMGFVRIYHKNTQSWSGGSAHVLSILPIDFRPGYKTALACHSLANITAFVDSSGNITAVPRVNINSGFEIRISGFFMY